LYISHVRDEGPGALDSFRELVRIAKAAHIPAQISHIKVAVASVWGKSKDALRILEEARKLGLDVTADVYPYTYWQSTITALSVSRDWKNPAMWEKALRDTGGPSRVRLTTYSPDPSWQGKTLDELEKDTGRPAAELIVEIVEKTRDDKGQESVLCEAMSEADVRAFATSPLVMFCSDGSGSSSHPRGRGAFPRVLAHFVREEKLLSLPAAVRKMTSFPAKRFGLADRGLVRKGMKADLVVFDPASIADRATATAPGRFSVGIEDVFVNGTAVIKAGNLTGAKPGVGLRHVPGKRLPRT
jgi:N-acyl-D-amino-acid deacylase